MENLSHSLPKKSYRSNGFAGKTVYDDVFGGPQKLEVHTFSPRVEDYSEIFEGFHASRGSSIPILDLPAVDDDDLFFDVRTSEFNYSKGIGGCLLGFSADWIGRSRFLIFLWGLHSLGFGGITRVLDREIRDLEGSNSVRNSLWV